MINKNIEILSGLDKVTFRDFLYSGDIDPYATLPLIQGEWLTVTVGSDDQLYVARPSSAILNKQDGTAAAKKGYVLFWGQKGRADTQGIKKVTCIIGGSFELKIRSSLISNIVAPTDSGGAVSTTAQVAGIFAPDEGKPVTLTSVDGRLVLCRRPLENELYNSGTTSIDTKNPGRIYGTCYQLNKGSTKEALAGESTTYQDSASTLVYRYTGMADFGIFKIEI